MPIVRSEGLLIERVAFEKPVPAQDGYGMNDGADWAEEFSRFAGYTHLRGGETVLASRLVGKHVIVVLVRSCAKTKTVTTDWRLRDTRTGDVYNIRDITPSLDRAWIDILCESGISQD